MAVVEQSLVKYMVSMSSASNTFEQRTLVHNYSDNGNAEIHQTRSTTKLQTNNLSQQDIEAAQKSDADAINQQQTNLSGVSGQSVATTPTQRSNVQGSEYL